jgi:glycerol-3-phosphate dehydrogenase (NAD(P)+)
MKIGVIGAGSWGTAIANLLARNGRKVDLWVREKEVFDEITAQQVNGVFLPGIQLDTRLNPVRSFKEAVDGKEAIVMVVPSHVYRDVLVGLRPHLAKGLPIVSATKGIENDTLLTMSQVAGEVLDASHLKRFSALSGPSFAEEVGNRKPTAVTLACADLDCAERLQELFITDYMRVYVSEDVIGVEIGGAAKNVIAIAAGAADGLGLGTNGRAALITRGLAEITRLGVAMGANPHTFAGLAGIGDLVLTCTGDLSRNRTVGAQIAKGTQLQEITRSMNMVAEGVRTTKSVYALGKKMNIDMPITRQVYQILYKGKDPRSAVRELMTREPKKELES